VDIYKQKQFLKKKNDGITFGTTQKLNNNNRRHLYLYKHFLYMIIFSKYFDSFWDNYKFEELFKLIKLFLNYTQ